MLTVSIRKKERPEFQQIQRNKHDYDFIQTNKDTVQAVKILALG